MMGAFNSGFQFSRLSRFLEEYNIINDYADKWSIVEEGGRQVDSDTAMPKYRF